MRFGQKIIYKILIALISIVLLPLIAFEKLLLGLQSQWSWSLPATIRSIWLIKKYKIKIIYSTGGAYSAHLTAYWLKKLMGIQWICEVHDPMVKPDHPPITRDQKFQSRLENKICNNANLIWWFTDGALKSAKERNPNLKNKGVVIIPGANPPIVQSEYIKRDKLIFAHFGSLSETRSLSQFFDALEKFKNQHPEAQGQFEVHIYGASLDKASKKILQNSSIINNVIEFGRLEYSKSLHLSGREQVAMRMQEADCLLLAHGNIPECSEYIPSKLYEYFWAQRPIFGMTHHNSQINQLIRGRQGYVAESTDIDAITMSITQVYQDWCKGSLEKRSDQLAPIGVDQATDQILKECIARGLMS
jgi:glycosyltransferase involved in cell wall biosynthesis